MVVRIHDDISHSDRNIDLDLTRPQASLVSRALRHEAERLRGLAAPIPNDAKVSESLAAAIDTAIVDAWWG
jgi:hypothetical protein